MSEERFPSPAVPAIDAARVARLLQAFADQSNRSFEATVDDLVSVRVGPRMNVLSVELSDTSIDALAKARLETAIASAVNLALQRAALAAGGLFEAVQRDIKAHKTAT